MSGPVDLLVALPAHNESALISACLQSVCRAVDAAQQAGSVSRARVAVAAHRCSDDTAKQARAVLAGWPGIESLVTIEDEPAPVGAVRTRLVHRAVAAVPALGSASWLFSTDADTTVPTDWVTATLSQARQSQADLVLGLADLGNWPVDRATRTAYEQIVADGLSGDGHRHAYAANLAIRWEAFAQVGGFPASAHGEEHGLAAACRAAGLSVVSTLYPRVQTSARMPGRAPEGLGALLANLARATTEDTVASSG